MWASGPVSAAHRFTLHCVRDDNSAERALCEGKHLVFRREFPAFGGMSDIGIEQAVRNAAKCSETPHHS